MAISLWIVLAVAVIVATLATNRIRASLAQRAEARRPKSVADKTRPLPRHTPAVSALIYS
jgi:hypothetical protein